MKTKSFAGMRCSMAGALELIGDRWALLLIRDMTLGLRRFEELRTSTGISAATLVARLRHLETSGIAERIQYQAHPPRDEYRLTAKGKDLWQVMVALREWGDRWNATGFGQPTMETIDLKTGRKLVLAMIDAQSGRAVSGNRIGLRPVPGAQALASRPAIRLS